MGKRICALLLAVLMMLSLCACGASSGQAAVEDTAKEDTAKENAAIEELAEEKAA